MALDVFIVESSQPADFYDRALDGVAVASLLRSMHVENELRMGLDREHFRMAVNDAAGGEYNAFHLSCHGNEDGIILGDKSILVWEELAAIFQSLSRAPEILVMSTCRGAAIGIGEAFKNEKKRPNVIFGSTESLDYGDYCAAWAILYNRLKPGVSPDTARTALKQITAVVHNSFVYRWWIEKGGYYRPFPPEGTRYEVKQVL